MANEEDFQATQEKIEADVRTPFLVKNGLAGWWFDGENCLHNAIRPELAKQLVTVFEAAGFEASWAPDNGQAWLYVTPRES